MTEFPRFTVSTTAGVRYIDGKPRVYAVVDRWTSERVAWYRSYNAARNEADRRNAAAGKDGARDRWEVEPDPTSMPWGEDEGGVDESDKDGSQSILEGSDTE